MNTDHNPVKNDKWYSRPIFSVSSVKKALIFYCEQLNFTQSWKYEEDGRTIVTQVNRGEFELILTENLDRIGEARVFVSLEQWELEKLKQLIEDNEISYERTYWGYPTIKITDPDGNELLFPFDDENAD